MWIDEYRAANNLELDDFARRVNAVGRKIHAPWYGTVTDTLIHLLETSKTPRTHPLIADAIATVCGATQEQRDSIVDEKHRGGWEPKPVPYSWGNRPMVWSGSTDYTVVMVDRYGRELHRYTSSGVAARYGEVSKDTIQKRCLRRIRKGHEFIDNCYTYRYAREWDKMNSEEKLKDLGVESDE